MPTVPSILTDQYDALLTTTARNMMPRLRNNINKSNKFLAWLQDRDRMRGEDGGERIQVPLQYGLNSTADVYQGYGMLRVEPQDGITSAFYEWRQLSVSITISRKEERQNSGAHRLLNLLQAKMTQAENSVKELLNNCIVAGRITTGASSIDGQYSARVGSMDSSALAPLSLTALIDSQPARSRTDIGNINPATYPWWQNQAMDIHTGITTYAGLKQSVIDMYTRCQAGVGGSPDLMVSDRLFWTTYFNALQNQERYIRTDDRTVNVLGGSQALAVFDAALVWDEVVPDVYSNANNLDGIGTDAASTCYFINSDSMEWIYDTETNFINTPFVRLELLAHLGDSQPANDDALRLAA